VAKPRKPCIRPSCDIVKWDRFQLCHWHKMLTLPIEEQIKYAEKRLARAAELGRPVRPRVPAAEWPDGKRWCAGCQWFVPLFYCTGSRCKACASKASHAGMTQRVYGLSREEFEALWKLQGERCYICRRKLHSRRPAVDHDHETGAVRGLLCADSDRGCNHAILGNIADLAMARRIVEYLEDPPYARLLRQR
jgi:hypothetical protein